MFFGKDLAVREKYNKVLRKHALPEACARAALIFFHKLREGFIFPVGFELHFKYLVVSYLQDHFHILFAKVIKTYYNIPYF